MQIRHRIPTIFNLSMVDVLCCALGCVILLWLLNLREARERALAVGETSEHLKSAQRYLDETRSALQTTESERDQTRRGLEAARTQLAALHQQIAALRNQQSDAKERLAKLSREQRVLTKEKAESAEQLSALEARLRDEEEKAGMASRRVQDLTERLRSADARLKKSQALAELVPELQADLKSDRSKLMAAESRVQALEAEAGDRKKELLLAGQGLDLLQRENKSLTDQVSRTRAAMENRFEGITLTGRRVVFLIDMSGSMELIDERTPSPSKWVGVRETVAKVMRSLPDLEKFQVILFSDKVSYLVGSEGQWLDFEPKTSVSRVTQALTATKPLGGTNMYIAFEAAFRLRAAGLDTIYVLSDGLPNIGPGLTAEQANNLKETEQGEILSKYIRNMLRRDWNRTLTGRPRVRINTIGFFYESPDVGAFLWALARENDGSFVGMSKP